MLFKNPTETLLSTRQRRAFKFAENAARQVLRKRFKVLRLTRDAYAKLSRNESSLSRAADDLRVMLRMTRAWARKEYQAVPWRVILCVVAAMIYFVNPADLIPDVLTGLGFVDDAAVIGAVVRSINSELNAFRNWESVLIHRTTAAITAFRERSAA
jgi:uncharacterized membrane protein YkvA (DUF1232 family)